MDPNIRVSTRLNSVTISLSRRVSLTMAIMRGNGRHVSIYDDGDEM